MQTFFRASVLGVIYSFCHKCPFCLVISISVFICVFYVVVIIVVIWCILFIIHVGVSVAGIGSVFGECPVIGINCSFSVSFLLKYWVATGEKYGEKGGIFSSLG